MKAQLLEKAFVKTKNSVFNGLNSYSESQSDVFFGRDKEKKHLYKLIKINVLTVLYGKSGTGKTSLLNAGVFPMLRQNYCMPFRIRFEFQNDSPDLITQVKSVLKAEISRYKFKVEAFPAAETLWEFFHRDPLWQIVTPILVFDQFEEIFTLAKNNRKFKEQLSEFLEEIFDLVENTIPEKIKDKFIGGYNGTLSNYQKHKVKVLFSFREDYLADIDSILTSLPLHNNSRFRLKAMNGAQADEVISKTWNNLFAPLEMHKVINFLVKEQIPENIGEAERKVLYENIEVEPALLSQVCTLIEEDDLTSTQDISARILLKYDKHKILRTIYEKNLDICQNKEKAREFIEENLIGEEGIRIKFSKKNISNDLISDIRRLQEEYLIREEGNGIELVHDVLIPLIKTDREARRSNKAIKVAGIKAIKKIFVPAILITIIWALFMYFQNKILTKELEDKEVSLKNLNNSIKFNEAEIAFLKDNRTSQSRMYALADKRFKEKVNIVRDSLKYSQRKNTSLQLELREALNTSRLLREHFRSSSDRKIWVIDSLAKDLYKFKQTTNILTLQLADSVDKLGAFRTKISQLELAKTNMQNGYNSLANKVTEIEQELSGIKSERESLKRILTNYTNDSAITKSAFLESINRVLR